MMDRRSFFGVTAAALAGAPAVAEAAMNPSSLGVLSVALDAAPLKAALGDMQTAVLGVSRSFAPLQFRSEKEYVYRTGSPAIDALRSVSGVHRALMEKRSAR